MMKNHRSYLVLISLPFKAFAIACLKGYKIFVSPYLPMACRYEPTCSLYMLTAIQHHGLIKGIWLGLRRIGRCHPWGGQGYDPIPKPTQLEK